MGCVLGCCFGVVVFCCCCFLLLFLGGAFFFGGVFLFFSYCFCSILLTIIFNYMRLCHMGYRPDDSSHHMHGRSTTKLHLTLVSVSVSQKMKRRRSAKHLGVNKLGLFCLFYLFVCFVCCCCCFCGGFSEILFVYNQNFLESIFRGQFKYISKHSSINVYMLVQ